MESNKKRAKALHTTYRRFNVSQRICYYCGVPANTLDHVPPLAVVYALGSDAPANRLLVPACAECNRALADKFLLTPKDRKRFIKEWLRKRYEYALGIPHWSEDELDDLGPGLREYVVTGVGLGAWVRRRLDH